MPKSTVFKPFFRSEKGRNLYTITPIFRHFSVSRIPLLLPAQIPSGDLPKSRPAAFLTG